MQGVRPCHFIDPSFCQSRHALKQSMWLVWLHSSYMFIWNQQGFHIGSCKKKPEASQKQSKPEENQNLVLNCLGLSETRTEIPTEITEIRTEIRTDRQQHHPYGLPYDQYILHVWGSDHRFYGNSFWPRHKHFISKGVMASRFISIEWGALTPSWVS